MRHPKAAAGPPGSTAADLSDGPSWQQLKQKGPMRRAVTLIVIGTVVMAGIGFSGSYDAVQGLAHDLGFGWFSYVLPIGVDAGIGVLLGLDLLLTWLRWPFSPLRWIAWLLTLATIAFNAASAWPKNGKPWTWLDVLAASMHAVIPLLFVIVVEAARHAVGRAASIMADKHMEGVRLKRWILAPWPTFKLWRRMTLWELRTYDEAISAEQARLVYRAALYGKYGRKWKKLAGDQAKMPLRLAGYGIPLWKTGPAALASVGIEIDVELLRPRALRELPAAEEVIEDAEIVESPGEDEPLAVEAARTPEPAAPGLAEAPADEQQFAAFHQFVTQNGEAPNREQLGLLLNYYGPLDLDGLADRYRSQMYRPEPSVAAAADPYGPGHRYGDPVPAPYVQPAPVAPEPEPYVQPEQVVEEAPVPVSPVQPEPVAAAPARSSVPGRVQAKVEANGAEGEAPAPAGRGASTRVRVGEIFRSLTPEQRALRGRPLARLIADASNGELKFEAVKRSHISEELIAEYEQGLGGVPTPRVEAAAQEVR